MKSESSNAKFEPTGKMARIPTLLALLAAPISAERAPDVFLGSSRSLSLSLSHSPTPPFTKNRWAAGATTRCHIGTSWNTHRVLFEMRGGSDDNDATAPSSGTRNLSESSSSADIIGSAASLVEILRTALVSGANVRGVGALAAVAALTILPLTALIKQSYAFVVGCGLSMVTMSLAMMSGFDLWKPTSCLSSGNCRPAHLLIYACLVHGCRMASMAILRDVTAGSDPTLTGDDSDTSLGPLTWLKRIPLAISVSVLYAVMMSPVLYSLRGAASGGATDKKSPVIDWIGVVVAYSGLALGAVTDICKYMAEPRDIKADAASFNEAAETVLNGGVASFPKEEGCSTQFHLARYWNIVGEGLFWVGSYLGGVSSFGGDAIAWICGTVSVVGVVGFVFVPFLLHQLLSRIKYDHEDQ